MRSKSGGFIWNEETLTDFLSTCALAVIGLLPGIISWVAFFSNEKKGYTNGIRPNNNWQKLKGHKRKASRRNDKENRGMQ